MKVLFSGTKWLIAEHRKCVAEFKRLKALIADLSKYIGEPDFQSLDKKCYDPGTHPGRVKGYV